jgi:hypothetical protein
MGLPPRVALMLAARHRRRLALGWLAVLLFAAQARAAEQCSVCHDAPGQFQPYHDPRHIGCAACHGGDPAAAAQGQAHAGLEAFPGRMATAARFCGQAACHPEQVARVERSLMHTAAGMIALTRAALGETEEVTGLQRTDLRETGVDSYLRKLCISCHLGGERTHHGQRAADRGGGCAACHLQVAEAPPGTPRPHPRLSLRMPDARCFGCHSRSSRIALNYVGLAETDNTAGRDVAWLEDGRAVVHAPPDVHAEAGMSCVDCHTAAETMGNGSRPRLMREGLDIQCVDCHGAVLTEKPVAELAKSEWVRIALSGWTAPDVARGRVPATARRGSALPHLWREGERRFLHRKSDGKNLAVPVMLNSAHHTLKGHERLTCDSCHAAWAPQCGGCHIAFDPAGRQWDHLRRAETQGRWMETRWGVGHGPPALGVGEDNRIAPFAPGMNLILELPDRPALRAIRYARISPHTTRRKGRTCASCHAEPAALGIIAGDTAAPGKLRLRLPRGWVREGAPAAAGLRPGERSLTPEEMHRIRRVGACLPCHDGKQAFYGDFAAALVTAATMRGHPPVPRLGSR